MHGEASTRQADLDRAENPCQDDEERPLFPLSSSAYIILIQDNAIRS